MPVQLIKLKGALEDEAEDLRELLSSNRIEFYETPAGNWGISMPAIWLRDDSQYEQARELVDSYEQRRSENAREEFRRLKQQGQQRRFADVLREHPIRVVVYFSVSVAILYFSIKPFLTMG